MKCRKLLLLLVCLAAPGQAPADDIQSTYDEVFGLDEKKVLATRSPNDDAAFAARLVESARTVTDVPPFQVFLCDKAYEFGIKTPAGYAAATEAMKLLARLAPDKKDQAQQKLLDLYQLQYKRSRGSGKIKVGKVLLAHLVVVAEAKMAEDKAGEALKLYRKALHIASFVKSPDREEIVGKSKAAADHHQADLEIARLEKVLKETPDDRTTAKRLLRLHLVEKGDQKRAAALLKRVGPDEALHKYVPLAVENPAGIPVEVCLELARWHAGLAAGASNTGKTRTLERAVQCYARFLDGYNKDDAVAAKAAAELEKIEKLLAGADGGLARLLREVKIISAGWRVGNEVRIARRGKVLFEARGQRARGITLVAVERGKPLPARTFDTYGDRNAADRFAETIEKLPRGALVILAVCDEATRQFNQRAQKAILSVGGKVGLLGQPSRCSYYLIGRKGLRSGGAVEQVSKQKLVYPPPREKRR